MAGGTPGREFDAGAVSSLPSSSAGGPEPMSESAHPASPQRPSKNGRRRDLLLGLLLLTFGAFHSVLYFGFHPVPNSDFCAFVKTGDELLSLHLPSSYKRAPVLCVLLAGLGRVVGGPHPELTAGWLLNGILHPLNLLLFWLVGRRILGRAAIFVAIIAILNPFSMDLLADPIAETTLLFFSLLTLHLICAGSRWSYLAAAVTSMVRYEGAALIAAALVVDLIESRSGRRRARALGLATLASLPLGAWVLGTIVSLGSASTVGVHYLQSMGATSGGKLVLTEFLKLLSRVTFSPLLELWRTRPDWAIELLRRMIQAAGLAALGAGTVLGLVRRNRSVLALSIFLWSYVAVHALHPFVYPRFCATIAGIVLIVASYGARSAWEKVRATMHVAGGVRSQLRWLAFGLVGTWLAALLVAVPGTASTSARSLSVPYVGMALVVLIALVHLLADRGRDAAVIAGASLVTALVIVSNQFTLVSVLGDGRRGVEYKVLADWFRTNAGPGEGIVCTNTCAVQLYAPGREGEIFHFYNVKASSPSEFVARCREKGIAYVAWDSDTGSGVGSYYYGLFHFDNVEVLGSPRSTGPYEFVERIGAAQGNHINLFRILRVSVGELER